MRVSPVSRVWTLAVSHPLRAVRVCAMGAVYCVMLLRALALYKGEAAALLAAEAALCLSLGALAALPLSLGVAALVLLELARREPELNLGHRAGAEGFRGQHLENTVGALRALLSRDGGPEGPLMDLRYIECDVQETSDGHVVVLHDAHVMPRSFPSTGPNVAPLRALGLLPPLDPGTDHNQQQQQQQQQQEEEEQRDGPAAVASPPAGPASNWVRDHTLAELQSLHLGGREGEHVPTLREFLAAARECGCRAPVAVEVKALSSDKGRRELVDALSEHAPYARRMAAAHPERAHPGFGFLSIIAFPNHYAASFGELGSPECARWTRRLAAAGVRTRACVFWQLDYARLLGVG